MEADLVEQPKYMRTMDNRMDGVFIRIVLIQCVQEMRIPMKPE